MFNIKTNFIMKRNYFGLVSMVSLFFLVSCENEELNNNQPISPKEKSVESELITLKSGATVELKDGKYFWMGDVMLSSAQLKQLEETGDIFIESQEIGKNEGDLLSSPATGYISVPQNINTRSTAIYPTPYNLWAMVRFTYAKSGTGTTLNSYTRSLVKEALEYWEAHTNVRFYNATDQPTIDPTYGFAYPYVNFCDGNSNASYVGRIDGRQDLTLVPYGCSVGTVIHEIGHAIGLLHEQCRYDRDNYVTVNINNVSSENRHNFDKRTSNYLCTGAFDFESIMLYSSYDFAINSSIPTMTKKDGTTFTAQRNRLSDLDKRFPNTYYLPYTARSDVYRELDDVVYDSNNNRLTEQERLQLQAQLNNGNPNPPAGGRIPNEF